MQSIETMLRGVPGFSQLDSASRAHLAAAGDVEDVGAGDILFHEGTRPLSLYVLMEGRVSLTGTAADASNTVIDILGPSSSFVLANVLTGEPYLMGAKAVSGARLVRISSQRIRDVVTEQPSAAMAMIRAMSLELGNMTRQVVDLKVRVAAQRLGTYLLSQVKEPEAEQAEFRLPVAKGLLAPWLGCRAENLSRAFLALRAYGVETHGSRVVLHDIVRLKAYVGATGVLRTARPPVEKIFGDAFRLRSRAVRAD